MAKKRATKRSKTELTVGDRRHYNALFAKHWKLIQQLKEKLFRQNERLKWLENRGE